MKHTAQVHGLDDVREGRPVDLGDDLRVRHAAGVEAHQHVFLVDAGQRGDGVHLGDALLAQELLVRAVAVDDRGLRQAVGQLIADGALGLDDLDARAEVEHLLCKVIGDPAAAD